MSINTAIIEKAYELSQQKMEMQFRASEFADQRAMNLAGVQIAASAILMGLASPASVPSAMMISAFLLIIAATIGWWSVRPTTFYVPGAKFDDVLHGVNAETSIEDVLHELGEFSDKHITENEAARVLSSNRFRYSFLITIWTLFIAVIPQLFARLGQ